MWLAVGCIRPDIIIISSSSSSNSSSNTGRDSSVSKATRYGLEGPGVDFPHPSRPALGPTQTTIQWVSGLSRG